MSKTRTTKTSNPTTSSSLQEEQTKTPSLDSALQELESQAFTVDEAVPRPVETLLEETPQYLTADQLHEQLTAQGKAQSADVMTKMYQLDQVIMALTAKKGKLSAAVDFVPVSSEDVIIHINGGSWPKARYVIYKNARICLVKDIPHIQAVDKLTTIDVNHPSDTGNLARAMAL